MRLEIGHTIDPVKDVLRVGFPSESNTLSACTHVCALSPPRLSPPPEPDARHPVVVPFLQVGRRHRDVYALPRNPADSGRPVFGTFASNKRHLSIVGANVRLKKMMTVCCFI